MSFDESKYYTEEKNNPDEVVYYRPLLWKRCFAILLDGLIASFVALLCFVFARNVIYAHDANYNQKNDQLNSLKIESGIFTKDDDGLVRDLVTYYNLDSETSPKKVSEELASGINTFFTFYREENGDDAYLEILKEYNALKLSDDIAYDLDGVKTALFLQKDGEIIENPLKGEGIPYVQYSTFYANYIDSYALGYFNQGIEEVLVLTKELSWYLIIGILVSLIVAIIICYYVIPLCFFRNKYTLGRLLFKIGLVDRNVLCVSFLRFSARFLIILFGEVILSIFTFGIPLIVTFTMSICTKKKQHFHDYMLGIEEVDTYSSFIYKNLDETIEKESKEDHINFKLK